MEETTNLINEINKLKLQLNKMEEKLKRYSIDGVPSIREGFSMFLHFPIGTFVSTELLMFFGGFDLNFTNFFIPFDGSMILSLCFSLYISSVLLLLSVVSNSCYKKCKKVYDSYEAIINYLEEEIRIKTLKYDKLVNQLEVCEEEKKTDIVNTNIFRHQMIESLLIARKYLEDIQVYDDSMTSFDVSEEEIQTIRRKLFSHKHR